MSDYTPTTDFSAKDSLPTGDANKIIKGSDFDIEFEAIETAIASKADSDEVLTEGDTFFTSSKYADLATWLAAYNATSVNDADVGNNGTATSLANCLVINNGYETAITNTAAEHKKRCILILTETPDTTPQDAADSRIGISVTASAQGSQHASGIRSNLQNSSDDGNGCTAIYTRAVSDTDANWSAATHAETRHAGGTTIGVNSENACYATTGTMIGVVVKHSTYGAETTHPITTGAKADCDNQYGIYIDGNVDDGASDTYGWLYGIWTAAGSLKSTGKGWYNQSPATYGIHFSSNAANSTADILLEGDSAVGIHLNGSYTSGNAIKIKGGEHLAWEGTGAVRTAWDSGSSSVIFYGGGTTNRFSINIDATPTLLLNGTQVVAERVTGWTAATGTAARTTFATSTVTTEELAKRVKALIDDLVAHGLIGT